VNSWVLAPIFVGILVVSQGILNKNFGQQYGLSIAVFVNATVFLILAGVLLSLGSKFTESTEWVPAFIRPQWANYQFQWWHLIPGICGFLLVLLIPWSIINLGASIVFLLLVSSQIVLSVLWDVFFNQTQLTLTRILAIVCVLTGAFFYTKSLS
jgi:transporter family-2 protein